MEERRKAGDELRQWCPKSLVRCFHIFVGLRDSLIILHGRQRLIHIAALPA
jgi:hypothetical protein